MQHEARAAGPSAAAEPLYVASFLAPWVLLSLLLPASHRLGSLGLLGLLAILLLAAGVWARRHAEARGLDGAPWSFAAVVTFGYSNAILLLWRPQPGEGAPSYVCGECGRLGDLHEPFCFGCGAHG